MKRRHVIIILAILIIIIVALIRCSYVGSKKPDKAPESPVEAIETATPSIPSENIKVSVTPDKELVVTISPTPKITEEAMVTEAPVPTKLVEPTEVPKVTETASERPTIIPTIALITTIVEPSKNATITPTKELTPVPTKPPIPSDVYRPAITQVVTLVPTRIPEKEPAISREPTKVPTKVPSATPTPTKLVTSTPTPTNVPTKVPTITKAPTKTPTVPPKKIDSYIILVDKTVGTQVSGDGRVVLYYVEQDKGPGYPYITGITGWDPVEIAQVKKTRDDYYIFALMCGHIKESWGYVEDYVVGEEEKIVKAENVSGNYYWITNSDGTETGNRFNETIGCVYSDGTKEYWK